jgi:hypothetical protein
VIRPQAVDDQDEDVQLAVGPGFAPVRAASGGGQDGRTGGANGTGLQQPPAAQARIHAAGE